MEGGFALPKRSHSVRKGDSTSFTDYGKNLADANGKEKLSEDRPFSCVMCGKGFPLRCYLKRHMRVHSNERPFSCSDCGKSYRSKDNLREHKKVHTGEKPYTCNECGKSFCTRSNLNIHIKIHTGEKPFNCSDCGKSFRCKDTLKEHLKIHTGERPFSCSDCGKSFRFKDNLRGHMRVHTGEKPYSCSVCGKGFIRKNVLVSHMEVHEHGNTSDDNVGESSTRANDLKGEEILLVNDGLSLKSQWQTQSGERCENEAIFSHVGISSSELPGESSVKEEFDPLGELSVKEDKTSSETIVKKEIELLDESSNSVPLTEFVSVKEELE